LPPRTLAGRRRDQLTKAPDYGAVLVAITVAQFYLSGMLQRTLPAGFIAPCLPTKTDRLPSGSEWLHEIKHDGFRVIARKKGVQVRLYSRPGNDVFRVGFTRKNLTPWKDFNFEGNAENIFTSDQIGDVNSDCIAIKTDLDLIRQKVIKKLTGRQPPYLSHSFEID